jgi:cytidylate kinase
MSALYEQVAIIGIGMIGGSFGLALREHGLAENIIGVARSEETRSGALQTGAADQVTADLQAAVRGADLVYLAAPVAVIPGLLESLALHVEIGCTVTDAGSVKTDICRFGQLLLPASFIGGHPMAGSEKAGVFAARADLFVGRTYLLTPQEADPELYNRFLMVLHKIGARPMVTTPEEHDRRVAYTSHLPHLWSSALAAALAGQGTAEEMAAFCGNGLRDTTRIAASDPELWRDIFTANRSNLLHATRQARQVLADLQGALEREEYDRLRETLEVAKEFRDRLGLAFGDTPPPQGGLQVAIDGPAGAGKSTVARDVAAELGYVFIDTGAMYRAVAYQAMQLDLLPGRDDEAIGKLAGSLSYEFRNVGAERHLFVDGQDVETVVRLPEVGRLSSPVSAIPLVRHNLVVAQRQMAAGGGVVMEGRDIGTVVLPEAEIKIYLTASAEERARRRYRQLRDQGLDLSYEEILNEQNVRDQRDSSRTVAPLRKADDAVQISSDDLTRPQVVARIVEIVREQQDASGT